MLDDRPAGPGQTEADGRPQRPAGTSQTGMVEDQASVLHIPDCQHAQRHSYIYPFSERYTFFQSTLNKAHPI